MIGAAALFVALPAQAGDWRRADTHHFIIYSDGSKSQLEDFAHEAEKFDALLRMLFRVKSVEEPNRLAIYMLSDAADVDRLVGPSMKGIAGFYRPLTEGSFAVSNRKYGQRDTDLDGTRVLFHEYAHHFMFRNFSIPAPAWFVEGFAEYVSTADFKKNGEWTFGMPAQHRAAEINYFGPIPIEDLLTKKPVMDGKGNSFYGWSWALTHMLYSDKDQRGEQIGRYMAALNEGEEPLKAAEAHLGQLDRLEKDLRGYVRKSMSYSKSPKPIVYRDKVSITELSDHVSETVGLTLQRLGDHELAKTRDKLRELVQQPGAGAEAWLQLALAEYDLVHSDDVENAYDFSAATKAVDRALALDVNHVQANVLKGRILLEAFDHGDDADDGAWEVAREYFLTANRANPRDPLPLYAFADSFRREGRKNEYVNASLHSAFTLAPESRQLRFAYAMDQVRTGQYDHAIGLLKVIANDPHGGGGGKAAIERIEKLKRRSMSGASADTDIVLVDEDDAPLESDDGDDIQPE